MVTFMRDESDDGTFWVVRDENTLESFIAHVRSQYKQHQYVQYTWKMGRQRTTAQNSAMWLWLTQLAKALNDAGYDMKRTLKPAVEIPWNKDKAKEHLWNPVQEIMTDKKSSVDLDRKEISDIQEVVARHIAQSTGVSVAFPTKNGG